MKRALFEEDHEQFRELASEFNSRQIAGKYAQWEKDHQIPREVWQAAGENGLLGLAVPEEFGGMGIDDYRFRVVLDEEFVRSGHLAVALALHLHDDLVLPYLLTYGSEDLKSRWLPRFVDGSTVTSCAFTEPGAGSDLRGVRTKAVRDGDDWLISGQKTFIGNGAYGDAALVLARTDGETSRGGAESFSLFIVERSEGYSNGQPFDKMGLRASDTAELFFDEVRVSDADRIGEVGQGLAYIKAQLPQARLAIAVAAAAIGTAAFEQALEHATNRSTFGQVLTEYQNTRFELADLKTESHVTQSFVDRAVLAFNEGELAEQEAAEVKLWASESAKRLTDRALQLHGGYGYIMEYPIAQSFTASRLLTIFGGTSEIMRETIGRGL
ncbi:acyl-CoA dehydrogenase family protein [Glutamicibacter sp.]|uniref:acyl-CoA dehydrogenase family protein n=1 Tax=Glutamicibacter sp. TaxID=1931995 RepID=UPI0028BDDA21|nr:acyl-CoA dehydrogenase family protein [Glutamicibacter sp.]